MIRVAMLSQWHVHANEYASQAQNNANVEIMAVWDEQPERGQNWAAALGAPFVADLEQVLIDPTIDAVVVDTPTNLHREIITAAARHHKHIFSEKVLGLTGDECKDIFAAVDATGVKLMLSLPRLSDSYYVYAQHAIDSGLLGRLNTVRCRVHHDGALPKGERQSGWLPNHFFDPVACGGGALIDLGAHPIYLANRLAGKPRAVTAFLGSMLGRSIDDHAVATVEYASGCIGILESGYVSGKGMFMLELHGTEGSLLVEDGNVRIASRQLNSLDWYTPTLPLPMPKPFEQWVDWILRDQEPKINRQDMYDLTLINEAARLSHIEHRRIEMRE